MNAKKIALGIGCVLLVIVASAAFSYVWHVAETRALAGLRAIVRGHDGACSNVAALAESRFGTLESRYRLISRTFGEGMSSCDPHAPNVRYEFLGRYRPNESLAQFADRATGALERDGWKRDVSMTGERLDARGGVLALSITNATDVGFYVKPELVDIDVRVARPFATNGLVRKDEYRANLAADTLSQMTIFYPQPLPSGMQLDDSLRHAVIDYDLRTSTISDDRGRRSRVDERPARSDGSNACTTFGVFYTNRADPTLRCPKIATTGAGRPVYVMQYRSRGLVSTSYGLVEDGTAILFVQATMHAPTLDRAEVLDLVGRLRPDNSGRKRL